MKKVLRLIKDIYSIKELRDKIGFTLLLLLVYRVGSYIPLPAFDFNEVTNIIETTSKNNAQGAGLLGVLSSFTGGAFSRASILSLGIMPYITASIVVQLLGLAVPYFQRLQHEGESGRKSINQITRWLTVVICLVQAPAYLSAVQFQFLPYDTMSQAYLVDPSNMFLFWIPSIVLLIAGTLFTMWLGERITENGIGNGVSLIIMVGILAGLPQALVFEFNKSLGNESQGGLFFFALELLGWILVIVLSIILVMAVRRIPVQYVSRTNQNAAAFYRSAANSARQYIPLKVNAAGVMPIIFAQALMFIPGLVLQTIGSSATSGMAVALGDIFGFWYNFIFFILIILFTFFYTAISIPVNNIAEDLKRNNGIIPKVKPGLDTSNYLDEILSRITLPGAIFLAFLSIFPSIVVNLNVSTNFAVFFGGTSLLIMVAVILDTIQQINTYLLNHQYDGLMDTNSSNQLNDLNG